MLTVSAIPLVTRASPACVLPVIVTARKNIRTVCR
jgi:hypothetical protein